MPRIAPKFLLTAAIVALAACQVETTDGADNAQNQDATNQAMLANGASAAPMSPQEQARNQERQRAQQELRELRFVVDLSDRKVRAYRGQEEIRVHDVAVGDSEHETPTGEWRFHRVDINPEWIPPDSEWAEDRERQPPGSPDNPMGRARLVFNMPYTIHGTDATDSLGRAVSHGSIRVSNENVIELAELLLRAGGAWEGEEWFRNMTENRDEEYQVPLPDPIPIEVQE